MPETLDALLSAFCRTPWGVLGAQPDTAEGMCKRVSLALLATLDRDGIEGQLWNMADLIAPEWGGPGHGQHYVIAVGDEALDVTARQFGAANPHPLREPLQDAFARWEWRNPIDPDSRWNQGFTEYITPRWRELPDVTPPGDELGWPMPPGS